jgi:hypothetical protein
MWGVVDGRVRRMEPIDKEIEGIKKFLREKFRDLPKIESKLASQDHKITYLIKKLARMEGMDVEIEAPQPIESLETRLGNLKRILSDHGLEVTGFNELGYITLKPSNETGFDTLRKLNTVFHISTLETYFEQYLD